MTHCQSLVENVESNRVAKDHGQRINFAPVFSKNVMWHDNDHTHKKVKFLEYFKFLLQIKFFFRKYTAWLFTDGNLTEVEQVFFLKQSIKFQGEMRKIASRNTLTGQSWPILKSWYKGEGPEQGFRHCFTDRLTRV